MYIKTNYFYFLEKIHRNRYCDSRPYYPYHHTCHRFIQNLWKIIKRKLNILSLSIIIFYNNYNLQKSIFFRKKYFVFRIILNCNCYHHSRHSFFLVLSKNINTEKKESNMSL